MHGPIALAVAGAKRVAVAEPFTQSVCESVAEPIAFSVRERVAVAECLEHRASEPQPGPRLSVASR